MAKNWKKSLYSHFFWTGEGEGEGEGKSEDKSKDEKKFTQADVDKIINKRFAETKAEKEKLVKELEKFKESQSLSEQEKTSLQEQIDNLNKSMRTAQEQAEYEKKELSTKHKTDVENLTKDRDTWKSRFNESTIKRAITDAAVSAGAEDPSQFVMMFSGATRLDEEKVEGKPTGNFKTMIKFQGLDENKKSITLDLPIEEAIPKMKEMGLHKNLFKHGANSGTGEQGGGKSGSGGSPSTMPLLENYPNHEAWDKDYSKWRSEYNLDGSKKDKAA